MGQRQSKKEVSLKLRLIDAAIRLAERHRWSEVSIGDIAKEAGSSPAEALTIFRSKFLLLRAFNNQIDETVLNDLITDPDDSSSSKDLLFDILMRRFEAMTKYRIGLSRIATDLGRTPFTALLQLANIRTSMNLTLEAAGISSSGPLGSLRVHGLIAIYIYSLNTWFHDESEDFTKTMAAVNQAISLAEKLMINTNLKKFPPS